MLEAILLMTAAGQIAADGQALDPRIPDAIRFESSVESNLAGLKAACETIELRNFDPPEMPVAKETHQQIDCQGFEFMGQPRLAEFVFADDQLKLVWILVTPEEREATVSAMRSAYQSEGLGSELTIAFPRERTAWRNEPAEVLFYADSMAELFEAWFGQQDD